MANFRVRSAQGWGRGDYYHVDVEAYDPEIGKLSITVANHIRNWYIVAVKEQKHKVLKVPTKVIVAEVTFKRKKGQKLTKKLAIELARRALPYLKREIRKKMKTKRYR